MKPVAIFRHSATEGPGYFATYLESRGVPWVLIKIDQGEEVPRSADPYAGLVLMGGPMSVNDDLPWIPLVLELVRKSVASEIPVLGHCLGGQLMSKALGGTVTRNPVKEIGWGTVTVADDLEARRWFGGETAFLGFHWHGETFSVPSGARRIAMSEHCANQAFSFGKHLGLQCHVEMTRGLIAAWCADWGREVSSLAASVPSVQKPEEMQRELDSRLPALNRVADRLYDRWVEGLNR